MVAGGGGGGDYAGGACVFGRMCVCELHTCLRICSSQETNSCKPLLHTETIPHTRPAADTNKAKHTL